MRIDLFAEILFQRDTGVNSFQQPTLTNPFLFPRNVEVSSLALTS